MIDRQQPLAVVGKGQMGQRQHASGKSQFLHW
jgi:hypothetical protein